jgi:hypothetical protein
MTPELAQKVINKRPYLETKIVTYKHNRVYDRIETYYTDTPLDPYGIETGYKCKENLDRIKLPCYCTFEWRGKRRLGVITNGENREDEYSFRTFRYRLYSFRTFRYRLNEIDKQTHQEVGSVIDYEITLKELIEEYKINIGKVKLTYYETI